MAFGIQQLLQIAYVADLYRFPALRLPLHIRRIATRIAAAGARGVFKDGWQAQRFGIAGIDPVIIGDPRRGAKGRCPSAVLLLARLFPVLGLRELLTHITDRSPSWMTRPSKPETGSIAVWSGLIVPLWYGFVAVV